MSEERKKHGAARNNTPYASLLKNPLIVILGYLFRFFFKALQMLCKKHYKIFNCVVILELLSICEFNTPSYYYSKNLKCFCIVYWKLNILRYLCPLLFPRPKILVVLFRNDDQTWEVKGEKRTSENRRKINGLKASKNWDEWKFSILNFFFSSYRNFQTILCLFE